MALRLKCATLSSLLLFAVEHRQTTAAGAGAAPIFGGDFDVAQLCRDAAAYAADSGKLRDCRKEALFALALAVGDKDADRRCVESWKEELDGQWSDRRMADDFARIVEAHRSRAEHIDSVEDCWSNDPSPRDAWHECCGAYPGRHRSGFGYNITDRCRGRPRETQCCAFGPGSKSYLAIPALMEVEVGVFLKDGRLLSLGQDGFLRKFGSPTVLWPAGYLLAQFLSDQTQKFGGGFFRSMGSRILELGTGIGAPSVAVAGNTGVKEVLATDIDPGSLRLVAENAASNGVSEIVVPFKFDWHSDEDVGLIKTRGPFGAIIGSSLLIETWEEQFWALLRNLVASHTIVVLVHSVGSIKTEDTGFKVIERVSGDHYDMLASSGDPSDFEVVILAPSETQCDRNAQSSEEG
mmetsp:Transcript_35418/g.105771  ORF Transcript_35418/g.105771 Transcript_35418/m.105771 type:complete len:407 (-) Transcript_35418:113-1333(-)